MKKIWLAIVAFILSFGLSLPVFASGAENGKVAVSLQLGEVVLVDESGAVVTTTGIVAADAGEYTFRVSPDQTLFLSLGDSEEVCSSKLYDLSKQDLMGSQSYATAQELADAKLFSLAVEMSGQNPDAIAWVRQSSRQQFGSEDPKPCLVIEIASAVADKATVQIDLTFSALEDDTKVTPTWEKGDYATLRLNFEIQNRSKPQNALIYSPEMRKDNCVGWGEAATLAFPSGQDANQCATQMSVETDVDLIERYNIQENSSVAFRTFFGESAFSGDQKGTLTLLNPWIDGDRAVSPASCRIYLKDEYGTLTDVTGLFSYITTDEDGNLVNGWRMKTRSLGCYVIADRELATSVD